MGYINTLALVTIATCMVWLTRAVIEFIDSFRLGPKYVAGNIVVTLSPDDRNLLANFHRRKPRVKKEV